MSESEVLLPRHKRVTSGYNSDNELNLSVDDTDAEIKRLSEETAKMERHLAVMSGHSSCESGHSLDDMEIQDRFKYITDRDVHCDHGRPLLSEGSPTVSPDHHHPGHQPTAGRQPSLCTSTRQRVFVISARLLIHRFTNAHGLRRCSRSRTNQYKAIQTDTLCHYMV